MDNPLNSVWIEGQIDDDSITLTLLSERRGTGARVEEVKQFTFDELQSRAGDIFSMRLSEETAALMLTNQQQEIIGLVEDATDGPEVGDICIDDNAPPWSDNDRVEVVEVTDDIAGDYYIDDDYRVNTVADANPSYPADDTVVRAVYRDDVPQYSDGTIAAHDEDDVYAFPESRLVEP